ncbi:MAG: PKD domain-containing protein [Acidimicrobiia bacterium]
MRGPKRTILATLLALPMTFGWLLPVGAAPITATVCLRDSLGVGIQGAEAFVNASGYISLGFTDVTGCVSTDLLSALGNRTFRIVHRGLAQNKTQNTSTNPLVIFQTTAVTVRLLDSTGANGISGAAIEFNGGGWQSLGSTDANGNVTAELLGVNTNFRVTHLGLTASKSQNTGTNPNIVFQTTAITLRLLDSTGANGIPGAVMQYNAGGYQTLGTTDSTGTVTAELLGVNTTFRVNHAGQTQNKTQNTATNPVVAFQTAAVVVRLLDSTGTNGIPGAVMQYNAGGYQTLGTTDSTGTVTAELLGVNTTFRVNHAGQTQNKTQNTATNPVVAFQTAAVVVRLLDSTGTNGIPGALIQYNTGTYQTLGTTDSTGTVTAELLGVNTTFRVNHAGQTQNKSQNTATDPNVVFQTGRVLQGTGPTVVAWWASAWYPFTNGVELLPGNVTFDMNTGPNQVHTVVVGATIYVPLAPTAPVVTAADQSANEGETVVLSSVSFVDQEVTQTHRATIDWGDGSASEPGGVNQANGLAGSITGSHAFSDEGSYDVEVCVSDDGNPDAEGCDTLQMTVANLAPVVTILGASGEEGTELTLSSLVIDADPVTLSWTVALDGTTLATGTNPDIAFTPADDGVYDVSLTADDGDGGITTATGQVTVANLDPSAAITGTPGSVVEDEAVTLGSVATDPGSTDLLTYVWTVALDGATVAPGAGPDFSFTPNGAGSYVVVLVVSDGDGGTATTQVVIEVAAVPIPEPEEPTPAENEETHNNGARHRTAPTSPSQADTEPSETTPADLPPVAEPESETAINAIGPSARHDQVEFLGLIAKPPAKSISPSTALILGLLWLGPTLVILIRTRLRRQGE